MAVLLKNRRVFKFKPYLIEIQYCYLQYLHGIRYPVQQYIGGAWVKIRIILIIRKLKNGPTDRHAVVTMN